MYRFAALMLGNEAEALSLVENTVATVDVDPCADPCAAKGLVRERVLDGALEIMHRQDPASFADLPAADSGSCLEDDDAALSGTEITELASGAGRGPLRDWLNRFPRRSGRFLCSAQFWAAAMRIRRERSTATRSHPSGQRKRSAACSGKRFARWLLRWCIRRRRPRFSGGIAGAAGPFFPPERTCTTGRYFCFEICETQPPRFDYSYRRILLNFLLGVVHPKHIP